MFDFMFPNHTCLVCEGELNSPKYPMLCDKCIDTLVINTQPLVLKDENEKQYFHTAISAFVYQEPVTDLILKLKYNGEGIVAKAVAPFLVHQILLHSQPGKDWLLMPVPLFKKRERKRGYNQSLLIAKELSKYLNLSVEDKNLIRVKDTKVQKEMTIKQRQENLKDAFKVVDSEKIKGRRIFIVDDVFTSGTTANECAKILRKSGARQVNVLTIAGVI